MTMNIQLPEINLNGVLPIVGLALIAVLCIVALVLRSLLHSRVAMVIAVIVGVVVAGPTLAFALAQIVGALVPLFVVAIVGVVGVVWMVQRNPDLMSVVRDVVPRRSATPKIAPQDAKTVVIDQLDSRQQQHAGMTVAPRQPVKRTVQRGGMDDWGLR